MSEWITYIAIAVSVTALGLAGLSWRESRRSANAATLIAAIALKESALRTRPWIALRDVVAVGIVTDLPDDLFRLEYDNIGSLPGFGVEISVELTPIEKSDANATDLDVTPLEFVDDKPRGIFPGERSKFHVSLPSDLGDTSRFWRWAKEDLKIKFSGTIKYFGSGQSGAAEYRTDFEGAIVVQPTEIKVAGWANMFME